MHLSKYTFIAIKTKKMATLTQPSYFAHPLQRGLPQTTRTASKKIILLLVSLKIVLLPPYILYLFILTFKISINID